MMVIFGKGGGGARGQAAPKKTGPRIATRRRRASNSENECIAKHEDSLANMYQCSCTIDRIADVLTYDEFVNEITFARLRRVAR